MKKQLCKLLLGLCTSSLFVSKATAFEITFDWSGEVERVFEWQPNALPGDIEAGDRVEGRFRFNASEFDRRSYRLGTDGAGYRYTYEADFFQSVAIKDQRWELDAGSVTLFNVNRNQFFESQKYVDFFTFDAPRDSVRAFPNLFDDWALGVFFADTLPSLNLFSSTNLINTQFDDTQITSRRGYITSRGRNQADDIVDGYYLNLRVDQLSIRVDRTIILPPIQLPIPLPGSLWLLLAGLAALQVRKLRHFR